MKRSAMQIWSVNVVFGMSLIFSIDCATFLHFDRFLTGRLCARKYSHFQKRNYFDKKTTLQKLYSPNRDHSTFSIPGLSFFYQGINLVRLKFWLQFFRIVWAKLLHCGPKSIIFRPKCYQNILPGKLKRNFNQKSTWLVFEKLKSTL